MHNPFPRTNKAANDVILLFPVLILVGIGIVMVYSASCALALEKFGSDSYFLKRQIAFAVLGFIALIFFRFFPMKLIRSMTYPLLLLSLALLTAVHISGLGFSAGGATRWLRFGFLSFQPSEFARFTLIVYLAYSLSKKQEKLHNFNIGIMPHLLVLALFAVLIMLQPDFGSVIILSAITWAMMFVSGAPIIHLLSPLIFLLPVVTYLMIHAPYRLNRIKCFLDPWQCSQDAGYQLIHSFMAFGTGGLFGSGVGKGFQKLFYLPEPHTDFIFSVIGEELGLVGVLLIIGLFMMIIWSGIRISMNTENAFGSFLAVGITTALGLQVCINMGVALAILPTKGLTLPFLSYGGTSLLLNMASIGLLMNIGAGEPDD